MISIDKPDKAAVIKWLRYVNMSLPVLAVLMVVISLGDGPKYSNRSLHRDSRSALGGADGSNGDSQTGTDEDSISPLIAAARAFSLRMNPPPKPKPPKPAPVGQPPKPVGPKVVVVAPPPVEQGSLIVNIASPPDGAEWRVDKGVWQKSETTIEKVKVGTHIVDFKPVAGWDVPGSLTVKITKDELTREEATYSKSKPPKPPAPQVTLTGTIIRNAEDSIVWVRLPGKNKVSVYFMGEMIQGYELTSVSKGSAVLSKDGYEFVVKMAKPTPQKNQPAKGKAAPQRLGRQGKAHMPPPPRPGRNRTPSRNKP